MHGGVCVCVPLKQFNSDERAPADKKIYKRKLQLCVLSGSL